MPFNERAKPSFGTPLSSVDPGLEGVIRNTSAFLVKNGLEGRCSVDVAREDQWYVLKGAVESHHTRAKLISMIPKTVDGEQWVIDRLKVAP